MSVNIITGKIDSGKTTKLIEIYKDIDRGDGFAIQKNIVQGVYIGQKIKRLSKNESMEFSYKKNSLPFDWDEQYSFNQYSFSEKGLMFARKIIDELLVKKIHPIFVDEIGPLELNGMGFADILVDLLKEEYELYLVIRDTCLNQVIKQFSINEYNLIEVSSDL